LKPPPNISVIVEKAMHFHEESGFVGLFYLQMMMMMMMMILEGRKYLPWYGLCMFMFCLSLLVFGTQELKG